jgi:hypothetical protein
MGDTASGIGLAMKYFGRTQGQSITQFKGEWDALTPKDKTDLTKGLSDGTETY